MLISEHTDLFTYKVRDNAFVVTIALNNGDN